MELRVPPSQKKKLKSLEKSKKERIEKKLDEIDRKLSMDIEPEKVVEKRLSGPLHNFLQQRVGDMRLWFEIDREKDELKLEYTLTKEEAEKYY